MNDEDEVKIESETGEESESEEEEPQEEKAEAKIAKLREELKATQKEKQEYMDGWQRAKADYVNALKRFDSDVKRAKQEGVVKAVEVLLPAFDALERAKDHGEIPEGFQAIAKQLENAFASLGLEELGKVGEQFNPAFHEAFGQEHVTEEEKDDTVTAVLEKGWRVDGHVIRPAKVRVAHYSAEA